MVKFRVEIFTDLEDAEEIHRYYTKGMNNGTSEILDFSSHPIETVSFESSEMETLSKFRSIIVLPTVNGSRNLSGSYLWLILRREGEVNEK